MKTNKSTSPLDDSAAFAKHIKEVHAVLSPIFTIVGHPQSEHLEYTYEMWSLIIRKAFEKFQKTTYIGEFDPHTKLSSETLLQLKSALSKKKFEEILETASNEVMNEYLDAISPSLTQQQKMKITQYAQSVIRI